MQQRRLASSFPYAALDLHKGDINGFSVASNTRRYLFTWPTLCTKGSVQQIREHNLTSLIMLPLLAYFYTIFWWMRDRAEFMYNTLCSKRNGHCDQCTGWAIALCRSSELQQVSWEWMFFFGAGGGGAHHFRYLTSAVRFGGYLGNKWSTWP